MLTSDMSAKKEESNPLKTEPREEELAIMKNELRSELEIMKDEVVGMISHVIRTPLAVLRESVSLVLDEVPGKLNPKQKELLSAGKQSLDGLIQSIEEVFEKSWDEIVHPTQDTPLAGAEPKEEASNTKKRILVVEDQASIINMLRMRLEANNYEVITARDGQEGLEKARKENPNLMILDIMLPKMNGYKVCQLLKADPKHRAIPIIISSGRTPQEIRKVGQEVGADAYVSKPFEAGMLLSKIKELLEKSGK
jgi:CheY-like chemotaxis protein